MDTLGLSVEDRLAYEATLQSNHRMRMRIDLLDLEHNQVESLTSSWQDGQTSVDTSQPIRRSSTVELFDPTHAIGLDTTRGDRGSVSPKYMLRARRGVYVESCGWVDAPLFCGPITKPARDGDILKLECQGKEYLAQDLVWKTYTVKKGTNKATAIRNIMRDVAGETRFQLATTKSKLTHDLSLTRQSTPWAVVQSIARSLGWVLFYDAAGTLVGRPRSTTPVFTFRTGPGGSIESVLSTGFGEDVLANMAYVIGGTPAGRKTPITAHAYAPYDHPLAPHTLGRNGVNRYVRYDVNDPKITKQAEADKLVKTTLASVLLEQVSLTFDSIPIPHLQEFDAITAVQEDTGERFTARVAQMAIPWSSAGSQTNGYLSRRARPKGGPRGATR